MQHSKTNKKRATILVLLMTSLATAGCFGGDNDVRDMNQDGTVKVDPPANEGGDAGAAPPAEAPRAPARRAPPEPSAPVTTQRVTITVFAEKFTADGGGVNVQASLNAVQDLKVGGSRPRLVMVAVNASPQELHEVQDQESAWLAGGVSLLPIREGDFSALMVPSGTKSIVLRPEVAHGQDVEVGYIIDYQTGRWYEGRWWDGQLAFQVKPLQDQSGYLTWTFDADAS